MKNMFRLFGIIALAAIIGFTVTGCGDTDDGNGTTPGTGSGSGSGSGEYTGRDVLGNTYSLAVGSSARAAIKGDGFKMTVRTRDGSTKTVEGTVANTSGDGTLTLKPAASSNTFDATTSGASINSVAGSNEELAQIRMNDGTKFTPRTFSEIYLRANRWESNDPLVGHTYGELWGSGKSVLVRDFPTIPANISFLSTDNSRYSITISGTANKTLNHLRIELQGVTQNDEWVYFGGSSLYNPITITANQPFSKTVDLSIQTYCDLTNFKEVVLQVTNTINQFFDNYPGSNINNGTIPANISNGQIMATISNFNISLKDTWQ